MLLQRRPLDVVHYQKQQVAIAFQLVQAHNIGMLQLLQHGRFAAEVLLKILVKREIGAQYLQRHIHCALRVCG